MGEPGSDLAGPQGTLARLRACVRVFVYARIQGYSYRHVCVRVYTPLCMCVDARMCIRAHTHGCASVHWHEHPLTLVRTGTHTHTNAQHVVACTLVPPWWRTTLTCYTPSVSTVYTQNRPASSNVSGLPIMERRVELPNVLIGQPRPSSLGLAPGHGWQFHISGSACLRSLMSLCDRPGQPNQHIVNQHSAASKRNNGVVSRGVVSAGESPSLMIPSPYSARSGPSNHHGRETDWQPNDLLRQQLERERMRRHEHEVARTREVDKEMEPERGRECWRERHDLPTGGREDTESHHELFNGIWRPEMLAHASILHPSPQVSSILVSLQRWPVPPRYHVRYCELIDTSLCYSTILSRNLLHTSRRHAACLALLPTSSQRMLLVLLQRGQRAAGMVNSWTNRCSRPTVAVSCCNRWNLNLGQQRTLLHSCWGRL